MRSAPPLASTGSGRVPGRRAFLKAAAAGPLVLAVPEAGAVDYASAAEGFAAMERLEVEVDARLAAVRAAAPGAGTFVESVGQDRARHRAERAEIARRLHVPGSAPAAAPSGADTSRDGLRTSQQALVHAHAESLSALGDRGAVVRLAAPMVDLARHLALIDLW